MTFVADWVQLFKRRAWKTKTPAAQLKRSVGDNELRRCLGPFDLISAPHHATVAMPCPCCAPRRAHADRTFPRSMLPCQSDV